MERRWKREPKGSKRLQSVEQETGLHKEEMAESSSVAGSLEEEKRWGDESDDEEATGVKREDTDKDDDNDPPPSKTKSSTSASPSDPNIDSDLYTALSKLDLCKNKQDPICFALAQRQIMMLKDLIRLRERVIKSISYREAGTNKVVLLEDNKRDDISVLKYYMKHRLTDKNIHAKDKLDPSKFSSIHYEDFLLHVWDTQDDHQATKNSTSAPTPTANTQGVTSS